ncbi:MAG: hypothetical protein F6K51_13270 [Moorea sp. SIO3I8]|nr:hypothetical protein [Moorena sp. SIO3I8]NEO23803.1 hypothetical protein [Moorena sp. SIO4A5]
MSVSPWVVRYGTGSPRRSEAENQRLSVGGALRDVPNAPYAPYAPGTLRNCPTSASGAVAGIPNLRVRG